MVDSTKACESDWVNADLVKLAKIKKAVITGPGDYKEGKFGNRLQIPVQIDGKMKTYSPNRDSATNCKIAWGADTNGWVGKTIELELSSVNGKVIIIARPTNAVAHNMDSNELTQEEAEDLDPVERRSRMGA
jgi:hypothetical protein|tara:strand:- start:258 stop:653 length:396 start_codon:yes stop_codon:yes gene_type:complete